MSVFRNLAKKLFGKSIEVIDLDVRFHKEANHFGHHGTLRASHVAQNLKDHEVRFVFVGVSTPPPMTPLIVDHIWEEAKAQGYVPHAILTYGEVLPISDLYALNDIMDRTRTPNTGSIVAIRSAPEELGEEAYNKNRVPPMQAAKIIKQVDSVALKGSVLPSLGGGGYSRGGSQS
jgi:hypothetical protein